MPASSALAAFVALALLAAPPAIAARSAGPPPGTIAVAGNGVPGSSVAERAARYRRLARAGVQAVRIDLPWARVEPRGEPLGDFDPGEVEREVAAIRKAGLKAIGILGYGHPDHSLGRVLAPTPARGGVPPFGVGRADVFPPLDLAPFAAYARAVAEHFGDEILAWEVWNEQNSGWRFWPPKEDPAAYGRLLCAAAAALREADPGTPVVFGGLFFPEVAGLPGEGAVDFLDQAYAADPRLGRCYDVLAYHPYPYPFTAPELDVPVRGSVLSAADQLRAVLERRGDGGKPLWITEVGWPTNERAYGVSEAKQAQYTARMAAATFAQGVPLLTFYTYGDEPDATRLNQEAAFGLFRADGSAKPAYAALRTFAHVFRGARFVADRSERLGLPPGQLNVGGRGLALEWARRHERLTAAWVATESLADAQGPTNRRDAERSRPVRIEPRVSSRRVEVVGLLGDRRLVRASHGRVRLALGPSPRYLLDARPRRGCTDRRAPLVGRVRWSGRGVRVRVADRGCAGLRRVLVALARPAGDGRCRFARGDGSLGRAEPCRRARYLPARRAGATFRMVPPAGLARGRYVARVVALDRHGNSSRPVLRWRTGRDRALGHAAIGEEGGACCSNVSAPGPTGSPRWRWR